jgi:hypothetical protein
MLLIGLGAGLLMPTATDAVVGAVPRGEAGVGAATNGVSIQVGGALGVAVIGSVLSTRYQHRLAAALHGQPLPLGALHSALGSLGGALDVAAKLPALDASALAQVARSAFMSGAGLALAAGAVLSCAGGLIALAALPARPDTSPSATSELDVPGAPCLPAADG